MTEKVALRLPLLINATAPNAFFSSDTVPNSTARLWITAGVGRRANSGTSIWMLPDHRWIRTLAR